MGGSSWGPLGPWPLPVPLSVNYTFHLKPRLCCHEKKKSRIWDPEPWFLAFNKVLLFIMISFRAISTRWFSVMWSWRNLKMPPIFWLGHWNKRTIDKWIFWRPFLGVWATILVEENFQLAEESDCVLWLGSLAGSSISWIKFSDSLFSPTVTSLWISGPWRLKVSVL